MTIRLRTAIPWAAAAALALTLSVCIPLFSKQDPARAEVAYKPLFPFYFQSNVDAPLEMSTTLGFPGYFRENPYRVSRPTLYAALAAARSLISPLVALFQSEEARRLRWGPWRARDHIVTYFLWIAANFALILLALRLAYGLLLPWFPSGQSALACCMLLFSPIVLLVMRETHLNALHFFTGIASLAFWKAALSDGLSRGKLFALSLALGLAFLGKPSLNGFAVGLVFCLRKDHVRKLALILPGVALPFLAWYAATKALGYPFSVPEVTRWKAGVWILEAGFAGTLSELRWYLGAWLRALGENLLLGQILLAITGAVFLWRGPAPCGVPGKRFLAMGALIAAADCLFYFLVHRVHAVYYMNTILIFSALAAHGLLGVVAVGAKVSGPRLKERERFLLALACLTPLQALLLVRQLPHYPG